MSEPSIFFSEVNRRQGDFNRRAFLLGGITGLGLTALGGRLALLQVVEAQRYEKLADSNQFNFRMVPPPRGRVLDRNGVVLASNRPNFRLMVAREKDSDVEAVVKNLCELVPIPEAKIPRLIRDIKRAPAKAPVPVMEDLSWEEFSRINVRSPELPGVTADMAEVRVYPFGGAFAHVIGYVAKVNDRDIKAIRAKGQTPDPLLYNPGFRIGRQGVEKAFDLDLRGKPGGKKVEVDAQGRVVAEDPGGDIPPTPGKEIVLTLDADVQQRALEVFGEESGAAVVMDCRTGDILCMASAPAFDANLFVRGLTTSEYRALADYERNPLLDKALSGTYPPGSTFKPTTALALLAAGVDPKERVHCGGSYRFGNTTFRCWKADGHGAQDMHDAIKNSCDVYFYHLCNRAGIDRIHDTAVKLGFGQVFDIGIPGQSHGIVPSTDWKKKAYKDPRQKVWQKGETLSVAIGQGALTVNALQMCVAASRIANGRKALEPRLIRSIGGVAQPSGAAVPDLPIPKDHLDTVRAGMAAVANDVSGGAYRQSQLGLGDVLMAGKTGTAQVRQLRGAKSRKNAGLPWKLKDHNLFIAFAPYDAPRYALAIIVQHGGVSGALAAAPKAREIMRTVLLKDPEIRARIEKPLPLPEVEPEAEVEGAAPDAPADVGAAPPPLESGPLVPQPDQPLVGAPER
ncbi:MAG: penicillin-binding protein 2 [Caulobacter sp.]|nr:penicillin-binding protein 2 [Caulobacter sp.]